MAEKQETPTSIPTCDPIPMSKWVKEDSKNPDSCRPCALPLTTAWYLDELTKSKDPAAPPLATSLTTLANRPRVTPLQIARELDRIKAQVSEPLHNTLRGLDCVTQEEVQKLD